MPSGRLASEKRLLQPNSAQGSSVAKRMVGRGPVAAVAGGVMMPAPPEKQRTTDFSTPPCTVTPHNLPIGFTPVECGFSQALLKAMPLAAPIHLYCNATGSLPSASRPLFTHRMSSVGGLKGNDTRDPTHSPVAHLKQRFLLVWALWGSRPQLCR